MVLRAVTVFCASSVGRRPVHARVAAGLGRAVAEADLTLVYGGGKVGLMGVLADACLAAGGRVIGVIPESLKAAEIAHDGLTDLRVVADMHERKALMSGLADGFVALPGGLGTWEELFEQITWSQLGYHDQPVVLLDPDGFYDPLLALLDRSIEDGFVRPETRLLMPRVTDELAALEVLRAGRPPVGAKWVDRPS
jgi:uncharacterized protein (TIGR00730 family)